LCWFLTSQKDLALDIEAKHFLTKELLKLLHTFLEEQVTKAIHKNVLSVVETGFEALSSALHDLRLVLTRPVPPTLVRVLFLTL
jgi:hypothetical protein